MQDKTDVASAQKMQADLAAKIAAGNADAESDQGGAPEAPDGTAKDKADQTADQQKKDSVLQKQLDETEEKRKQLARINAKQGEKAKHYQIAAVDAIARLSTDQARELLEQDPTLKDSFDERHPDFFTSSEEEEEKPAKAAPVKKSSQDGMSQEMLVAKAIAEISKAAIESEHSSKAEALGVLNGLNKEQAGKLRKVATAIVNANPSIPFEDALKSTFELEYGKSPASSSTTINAGSGQSEKEGPLSEEEAGYWKKNFGLTGESAQKAQREANKLYKSMNQSAAAPR